MITSGKRDYLKSAANRDPLNGYIVDVLLKGDYPLSEVRSAVAQGLRRTGEDLSVSSDSLAKLFTDKANALDNGEPVTIFAREIPAE